ncbi:MAG: hypothetical protein AB7F88_07190 [Pyrinomonadaceae bacterium]
MANKPQRVIDLEEGIAEAVAVLRETPVSFLGLQEGIDNAIEALAGAYGKGFEENVSGYMITPREDIEDEDPDDDGDFEDDEEEEDNDLEDE